MPTYQSLTWSDGDQLTSVKFQQMASNTDWLLGNTIQSAALLYELSPSGAANGLRGRSAGTIQNGIFNSLTVPAPVANPSNLAYQATQAWGPISLCGIFCALDSANASAEFEVIIPLPTTNGQPYFAAPPIFSVTYSTGDNGAPSVVAYISEDYSVTEVRVHLFYLDGVPRNFAGVLHVLALGVTDNSTNPPPTSYDAFGQPTSLPSQSYLPVVWQTDDEVLASKLQQMQTNAQWVHDNTLLQPQLLYEVSPSSASGDTDLRGRLAGQIAATKICGIFCAYDSPNPVASFDVVVPLPPSMFTASDAYTPIYSVAVSTGTLQEIAYISNDAGFPGGVPSELTVTLVYRDGIARNFAGVLHVLVLGW